LTLAPECSNKGGNALDANHAKQNMKLNYSKCRMTLGLLLGLGLIGAGCTSTAPVAWNLNIKKSTPASIDVDIVGVQPSDEDQLKNMKPDDWWAAPPNNKMRQGFEDMMRTTNFQSGETWVVPQNDPIWTKWIGPGGGVTQLMVIANLPGVHDNTPTDPRRKFLKLNKQLWKDATNETLEIRVQDDRVRVITPMQMEK
jgi:hypothetical protein